MLDLVEPRENLRACCASCSSCTRRCRRAADGLPETEGAEPVTDPDALPKRDPPGTSSSSRATSSGRTRSTTSATSSTTSRSCTATGSSTRTRRSSAALARLGDLDRDGRSATRRATRRSEMMERNFGMPNPEGYRKGMRLMQLRGAVRDADRHLRRHAGRLSRASAPRSAASRSRSPSRSWRCRGCPSRSSRVVTGEGGSGGALALAVGDRVLMMENSYYSVISPEGCSTILFKDARAGAARGRGAAPDRARPAAARDHGRGRPRARGRRPHRPARRPRRTSRPRSSAALRELLGTPADELLEQRYERFRKFGAPGPAQPLPPIEESDMTDPTSNHGSDPFSLGGGARPGQAARGPTVQRFSVEAGETKIEIERTASGVAVARRGALGRGSSAPRRRAARAEPRARTGRHPVARAARRDVLPVVGARAPSRSSRRATSSRRARRSRSSRR